MEMTLAEFLGWEENVEYRRGGNIFKVDGSHLMDLRSNDYWGNTCCETWELLELRNAVRVKPEPKKYYLRHKFLGSSGYNYLNYFIIGNDYIINDRCSGDCFKSEFTDSEIKEIEATGFDLRNFERVEVEDE